MKQAKIKTYNCNFKTWHNPQDIPLKDRQEFEKGDEAYFKEKHRFIINNIPKKIAPSEKIKQEFDNLIDSWIDAIKYQSLESQQIKHPSFLRIIAIGNNILPYIFEEFSKRPFVAWLKALQAITGHDVASEAKNYKEAVELWLKWGRQNNYLKK